MLTIHTNTKENTWKSNLPFLLPLDEEKSLSLVVEADH